MGCFKSNAIALRHTIVRPEMKVIRGDSSVLLPRSSLHSARASKNYNLILFRTILHPPDSFVSKNEGMAEGVGAGDNLVSNKTHRAQCFGRNRPRLSCPAPDGNRPCDTSCRFLCG